MKSFKFSKQLNFFKRITVKAGCLNKTRFFFIINGSFGSNCYFLNFLPLEKGEYYLVNKSILTSFFTLFNQTVEGVTILHKFFLQMVGVGYKSYIPRSRQFKHLILKVGFGSVDLGFNLDAGIKGRARKQKFILLGTNLSTLAHKVRTIINLKYPNSYTGKGIRIRGQTIILKKNKQQQRSK